MSESRESEPQGAERRRDPRVDVEIGLRIQFGDFRGFVDECCRNLSIGGMFVESAAPPKVGASVRFELSLPEPSTTLVAGKGEVVWVRREAAPPHARSGFGVRFTEIDPISRELIFRTVDRYIQRGGEPFDLGH